MSETKNVVIQQNNGIDYDKLHPETVDLKVNLTGDNVSAWGNTLKEALPKINSRLTATENNQWEIGDIRTTVKLDLGEKWLKANGDSFDITQYPELAKISVVKSYPFGIQNVQEVKTVPGIARFGESLNETNLNVPSASFVNGYYIRTKFYIDPSNFNCSFLIHYSLDLKNWNTNRVTFKVDLTSLNNRAYSPYFCGVGYEHGYWYFSFTFWENQNYFIYGENIEQSNWTLVKLNNPFNDEEYKYDIGAWSGALYWSNSKWYTFIGVHGNTYTNTDRLGVIVSDDISFSSATGNFFSARIGENWYITNKVFYTFRTGNVVHFFFANDSTHSSYESGWNYYSHEISASRNGAIERVGNKYWTLKQIIKRSEDETLLFFYNNSGDNHNIVEILNSSGKTEDTYSNVISLIRNNGEYVYYFRSDVKKISVYTANNDLMSNYTTQQSEEFSSNILSSFLGNVELDDGIYYYSNDSEDNSTVYKISFGGVLPDYSVSSSSLTKLNTFIKALD